MAYFQDELSEERHFTLSVMKLFFEAYSATIPDAVQNDIIKIEGNQSKYFTNDVVKALLSTLRNFGDQHCSFVKGLSNINENQFSDTVTKLKDSYNHREFLQFLSVYVFKCVNDYSFEKYEVLCSTIESVLLDGTQKNGSWKVLHEVAQEIIQESEENCQNFPRSYVVEDMEVEQRFLLEVMFYVYELHNQRVPQHLIDRLPPVSDNIPTFVSNKIKRAIEIIRKIQNKAKDLMTWDGIEMYLTTELKENFNFKNFIELCYCMSQKAVTEYYEKNNWMSPLKACEILLFHFKRAKVEGLFSKETCWEEIQNVAETIILEDQTRTENPNLRSAAIKMFESAKKVDESKQPIKDCDCCRCS